MMEIEFIPLKTPDGVTCGHARVRGGFVELFLRTGRGGDARVWTDGGYFTGQAGTRIRVSGQVDAIALTEGSQLRCRGFSRGGTMQPEELNRRVAALTAPPKKPVPPPAPAVMPPQPAPAPAPQAAPVVSNDPVFAKPATPAAPQSAPQPAAKPVTAQPPLTNTEQPFQPIPAAPPAEPEPFRPVSSPPPAVGVQQPPAHIVEPAPQQQPKVGVERPDQSIRDALRNLAAETADDLLGGLRPQPPAAPRPIEEPEAPAPVSTPPLIHKSAEETAMDADSFSELLARAGAVFARIDFPQNHNSPEPPPPLSFEAAQAERSRMQQSTAPFSPDLPELSPESPDEEPVTPVFRQPLSPAPEPVAAPAKSSDSDWYRAVDELIGATVQKPVSVPTPNPFPHIFPNAGFQRVMDSTGETLVGDWYSGSEHLKITAVRGDYSPQPPVSLVGFTRYIRAKSGGYWVRVDNADE